MFERSGGLRVYLVPVRDIPGVVDIFNDADDLFAGLGGDDQQELQWEPVELPTKLSDHFKDKPPGIPALSVQHLKDPSKCTPLALLADAVFKDHPEKFFPPQYSSKRKRCKGPDKGTLGRLLQQLQISPYAPIDWQESDWVTRRQGRYEYHADFRAMTGLGYHDAKKISSEQRTQSGKSEQATWSLLAKIRSYMYTQTKRGMKRLLISLGNEGPTTGTKASQSEPDPPIGQGCGLLRTHHTDVHNQHPEISQTMILDVPLAQRLKLLSKLSCLIELHKEHSEAVSAMAKQKGFPTYATTIEICMNSKDVGRIHLHDFMGSEVTHGVDDMTCRKVNFRTSDLYFQGIRGHHVLTKGRGINKIRQATAQGLYYVTCNKIGRILTTTSRKPFEDLTATAKHIPS